jgi:hypothetical protein
MSVTLVKSILSACAKFTSIIENPSVYAGCVFKIRRIFALSFNGTDTTKTYLLITTRTDEISDIHISVTRIEVVDEREFS